MFWTYFKDLFLGMFWNSNNFFIQTLPSYFAAVGAIASIIIWLTPQWSDKMKNQLPRLRKYVPYIIFGLILFSLVSTSYSLHKDDVSIHENDTATINKLQQELTEANRQVFALPDELLASHLSNLRIRLTDLTKDYALITDKIYDNCEFFGPAVIQFQDPVREVGTITVVPDIGDSIDSIFIASPNERLTGVIAFKNCIFNNCRFRHIGIIAKPEVIEILKSKTTITP